MLSRAITEGWDVPPESRKRAIEQLGLIVDRSASAREVTAAAKGLMAATRLQLDEARLRLDERKESNDRPTLAAVREALRDRHRPVQSLHPRPPAPVGEAAGDLPGPGEAPDDARAER